MSVYRRDPIPNVVSTFAEQFRQGRILAEQASGRFVPLDRTPFDLPVFDFGHIADRFDPAFLGYSSTESEADQYFAQAMDALKREAFRLPFSSCAYLFRYHETDQACRTACLHVLEQDDEGIRARVFHYKPEMRVFGGAWTRFPVGYEIVPALGELNTYPDYPDARPLALLQNLWTEMAVATMFLRDRGETVEADLNSEPSLGRVNAGRAAAKFAPLSIRIVTGRPLVVGAVPANDSGSVRCPHERQGHERRLRKKPLHGRGRPGPDGSWLVPVRACSIHGGSEKSKIYEVV
jgi:hypothetical protein